MFIKSFSESQQVFIKSFSESQQVFIMSFSESKQVLIKSFSESQQVFIKSFSESGWQFDLLTTPTSHWLTGVVTGVGVVEDVWTRGSSF